MTPLKKLIILLLIVSCPNLFAEPKPLIGNLDDLRALMELYREQNLKSGLGPGLSLEQLNYIVEQLKSLACKGMGGVIDGKTVWVNGVKINIPEFQIVNILPENRGGVVQAINNGTVIDPQILPRPFKNTGSPVENIHSFPLDPNDAGVILDKHPWLLQPPRPGAAPRFGDWVPNRFRQCTTGCSCAVKTGARNLVDGADEAAQLFNNYKLWAAAGGVGGYAAYLNSIGAAGAAAAVDFAIIGVGFYVGGSSIYHTISEDPNLGGNVPYSTLGGGGYGYSTGWEGYIDTFGRWYVDPIMNLF